MSLHLLAVNSHPVSAIIFGLFIGVIVIGVCYAGRLLCQRWDEPRAAMKSRSKKMLDDEVSRLRSEVKDLKDELKNLRADCAKPSDVKKVLEVITEYSNGFPLSCSDFVIARLTGIRHARVKMAVAELLRLKLIEEYLFLDCRPSYRLPEAVNVRHEWDKRNA